MIGLKKTRIPKVKIGKFRNQYSRPQVSDHLSAVHPRHQLYQTIMTSVEFAIVKETAKYLSLHHVTALGHCATCTKLACSSGSSHRTSVAVNCANSSSSCRARSSRSASGSRWKCQGWNVANSCAPSHSTLWL